MQAGRAAWFWRSDRLACAAFPAGKGRREREGDQGMTRGRRKAREGRQGPHRRHGGRLLARGRQKCTAASGGRQFVPGRLDAGAWKADRRWSDAFLAQGARAAVFSAAERIGCRAGCLACAWKSFREGGRLWGGLAGPFVPAASGGIGKERQRGIKKRPFRRRASFHFKASAQISKPSCRASHWG